MPDIKTLMQLTVITGLINAGSMAIIWSQNRRRYSGIWFWLVSMGLQVIGATLLILRGQIPDLLSMVLANALILWGVLIMLVGLERFVEKKNRQTYNYILLAVSITVIAYFSMIQPNLTVRNIAIAVMLLIYTFQCSWLMLRRADPNMQPITLYPGLVFACIAGFNLARIILTILFPEQGKDFYHSGAVNVLAIIGYITLNLCVTISLILMVNRRLVKDVGTQEEKFSKAFHSSPYAIILSSPSDARIIEVNDGFVSITGYQHADVSGKTTPELNLWVNERDRNAVMNELALGHDVQDMEYQFRHKTGQILTGIFSARLIAVNNNPCLLVSINDITKRKQAQEALRKSDERYQKILETIEDGYFEVDLAGSCTFFNHSTCRMIGYTADEMMGTNYRNYTDQKNSKIVREAFNQVFKTGHASTGVEYEIFRKDGTRLYIETSASAIRNEAGQITGFRGIIRNITERKKIENALRESEERYRSLFESAPSGLFRIDLEGHIVDANPALIKILGYQDVAAVKAINYFELCYDPIDAERLQNLLETRGVVNRMEIRLIHPQKEMIWGRKTVWRSLDSSGNTVGYDGIIDDVSEYKMISNLLNKTSGHFDDLE